MYIPSEFSKNPRYANPHYSQLCYARIPCRLLDYTWVLWNSALKPMSAPHVPFLFPFLFSSFRRAIFFSKSVQRATQKHQTGNTVAKYKQTPPTKSVKQIKEIISRNLPKYFVIYQNNCHGLFAMTQGFEKVPVC